MGKIIQFPVSYEMNLWCQQSKSKLKVLIQACNMSNEKGFLDKRQFQALLNYCGIDTVRDFTSEDRAILQFHIDNYYELDVQV